MTLTKTKIHFILLLTASLLMACSMDDDDAEFNSINGPGYEEVLAAKCITLPGDLYLTSGLDSLDSDTLKVFPDDVSIHKTLMQCLVSSQYMVSMIASSIDAAVFGGGAATWMDYYYASLGVYSSDNDSRSKQWGVEENVFYDGVLWDYCLNILDLPGGAGTDDNGERAIELYYDKGMSKGVMIFSPTSFDAVNFPSKIFGTDIKGMFRFDTGDGRTVNELFLTNIGVNNNVKYIRNVYLRNELYNDCVSIKGMVDFPALWFDTKENSGFTASVIGAFDRLTGGEVLYAGIVPNSSLETEVASLVTGHPVAEVLDYYYPLWQDMIDKANESDGAVPSSQLAMLEETLHVAAGEGLSAEIFDDAATYGQPGYYLFGDYMPDATVTDKSPYLRALNKTLDMMDGIYPISPYKNSVNQIEWSSSEKSR